MFVFSRWNRDFLRRAHPQALTTCSQWPSSASPSPERNEPTTTTTTTTTTTIKGIPENLSPSSNENNKKQEQKKNDSRSWKKLWFSSTTWKNKNVAFFRLQFFLHFLQKNSFCWVLTWSLFLVVGLMPFCLSEETKLERFG